MYNDGGRAIMIYPQANSYFSGAGGMDLGLKNAGVEIVQSLEIDKNCIETLECNFSHNIQRRNIKNILALEQGAPDIIVGTYPCNHYSAIADIKGTRSGDDLFLHFFRHIALMQPEMYIVENVPGMRKFPVVMEAMTKLPSYYINILCPVNANLWLPQSRSRLILIGTKKPFKPKEPIGKRAKTIKEILEQDPDIDVPRYVINRLKGKYRDLPRIIDPSDSGSYANTCVANYGREKGQQVVKDKRYKHGIRPFTVREYARLQGFPDWFTFKGCVTDQYKQIGNAVAVPVAEWVGEQAVKYFN